MLYGIIYFIQDDLDIRELLGNIVKMSPKTDLQISYTLDFSN